MSLSVREAYLTGQCRKLALAVQSINERLKSVEKPNTNNVSELLENAMNNTEQEMNLEQIQNDLVNLTTHMEKVEIRLTALETTLKSIGDLSNLKGEKGDKGEQGIQGLRGEQGVQGERGPQGNRGERGLKGPAGKTGEQGPPGKTGEQGPAGKTGEQGPPGKTGEQGPPGNIE
jgi:hypothetical protein